MLGTFWTMQTVVEKHANLPFNLSHLFKLPNIFVGDWFNTRPSLIIREKECTPIPTILTLHPPFTAILARERSTVRGICLSSMALGFLISALIVPVLAIEHIHDPDWRAFKSKFRKTLCCKEYVMNGMCLSERSDRSDRSSAET